MHWIGYFFILALSGKIAKVIIFQFLRQKQCVLRLVKLLTPVMDLLSPSTRTYTLEELTLVLSVLLDISRPFVTHEVPGQERKSAF